MNVVGYIRVSTQGQARDGYSLKYQEDEIKACCEEQGWNLIHIFRDEGISGAKLNEEALEIDSMGLQEMLAHLSSVQIDYVVVLNTSRLWRLDIVKVLIQRELKKYGCDIKSIEQHFTVSIRKIIAMIINCWQERLDEIKFENKPFIFLTFLLDIDKLTEEGLKLVCRLEDVDGYGRALAQYLMDHGQVVKEVNPVLSYAGQKSDMITQRSDSWNADMLLG